MCRNFRYALLSLSLLWMASVPHTVRGQLRINEILTANISANFNTSYNYTDWVELYNAGYTTVNLNGYSLSDDPDEPGKFTIWNDIYIYPGQYIVISLDKRDYVNDVYIHANFSLDVEGEYLGVYNASGSVDDSLHFGKQARDISYGRLPYDTERWVFFKTPTPGSANNTEWLPGNETAGNVTFSVEPGFYQGMVSVEMHAEGPSDRIVYTLNGDYPKTNAAVYGGPIFLTENTVIRARCLADDLHPGPVSSATYFIGTDIPNLPVVSVSTDDANFYNWTYGYYCDGNNGVTTWCSEVPVNWARDWERPLNIEYFTQDGLLQHNQLVGSKIFGGCSRANALRSFSLISREDYGKKGMDYNFFVTKDVDSYKSMVLRNSGSDVVSSMLRDGFMQTLLIGRMDVDYQAYQPVLVYLNGEYFALMNLREKMNEHWVASNYDIDPDNIDIIEKEEMIVVGNDSAYQAMMQFIREHDLGDAANFEEMKTILDVDHYMDYYIANIYYENEDWPQNNVKFWRERKPGAKWRIMLFDTDCGFHLYPRSGNTLTWALRPHPSTEIFVALMRNESFKNEFIQRFAAHMNTTFAPERVLPVLDSLEALIEPHIRKNISMYQLPYSYVTWDWHVNHTMVDFANTQADTVRIWLSNYFSLSGSYPLSVSVDNPAYGSVTVNKVEVGPAYEGQHFRNIPVRLVAHPQPGFRFAGWTGDVNSGSPEIYITRSAATGVTALFAPAEPITGVYINELVAANETGLTDDFGEQEDWIELYNSNDYPVDIAGLFISDSAGDAGKYQIPYGQCNLTTIPAYGYLILWADNDCEQGALHLSFKLKRSGETLSLAQTIGGSLEILDYLTYEEQFTNSSFGRDPYQTSQWKYLIPTPGAVNQERQVEHMYINEFMASNRTAVADEYGTYSDWIEIYNDNDFPVDLGGLFISDSMGNPLKYRIPDHCPDSTTIAGKGFMVLWADDSTSLGVRHLNFKLSGSGEEIILTAPNGIDVLDSVSYPDLIRDAPWARHTDGSGEFGYLFHTPGASNVYTPPANVYINEVMASNTGTRPDNFNEYDDWIEIYNANNFPVNIAGMFITDSRTEKTACRIPVHTPDSTLIGPRDYLLLWADDSVEQGILHLNFKLSSNGEFLGLLQADGSTWIDSLSFGPQNRNISYGRSEDGSPEWTAQLPTPEAANVQIDFQGIKINEIMASDQSAYPDENGEYDDWIELYNPNDHAIDIAGMYITDSLGDPVKYQIPYLPGDTTTILPGGYLILWADNQPEQGILHLDFKLREGGEWVGLFELDETAIDTLQYGNQYNNFSCAKTDNGKWLSLPPTPGTPNTIPPIPNVYINEYMADNMNRIADEFGEYDDWIEIFNGNNYDVNLAGLYLSDSLNYPDKYRIPSNDLEKTILPARSYMIIWTDDDSKQGPLHTNFKLSRQAENIRLSGYDYTQALSQRSWVKQPKNFSTARIIGSYQWMDMPPTPGAANTLPDYSGLFINEIMASNQQTIADNYGEYDDWIEFYNSGNDELDIGGIFITDNIDDDDPYRISSEYPDSTTIAPGGYLLIWADDSTEQGIQHVNFKLSRSGETAVIFGLDRITPIDSVTFKEVPTDNTWGRTSDGGLIWNRLLLPTPLASNVVTAIEQENGFQMKDFQYSIFPNPASSECVFRIYAGKQTDLVIRIYSLTGELVKILIREPVSGGRYDIVWDLSSHSGRALSDGIYFYTIETDTVFIRDKLIISGR